MQKQTRHILHITTAAIALLSGGGICAQDTGMHLFEGSLNKAAPLFRNDTLTVRIFGDIMMHSRQIETAASEDGVYDFSSYFSLLSEEISNADIVVANMEFTLAGRPYTGYPCFSAPDSFAPFLAETGFDVFLAANTHIFDKGQAGAIRTISIYRELEQTHGIRFTGLAENEDGLSGNFPLTIRRKGISVALVNFTYGTNSPLSSEWPKVNLMDNSGPLAEAFRKAQEADFTIALPHWGTEYRLKHSERQEKTAQKLADMGADIIIGAHPHVIQDFALISAYDGTKAKQVPVAYSLGNAVSNMSAANTQLELMATIRIARNFNGDLEMLPVEMTYLWCSAPGGYGKSYTVIPVADFIGRRNEWAGKWDYDKMVRTYSKVMQETGIKEGVQNAGTINDKNK